MHTAFPLPDVTWAPTRPFWEGAARRQLVVTRCELCGRYVWYPQPPCRACGGTRLAWAVVCGRGRLFSWSIVRHAFLPQFAAQVPFVAALVALAEDPSVRLVTALVDCDPERLRCDMPVHAVFRPLRFPNVAGEVTAPLFTPGADHG
jgi:uncharacterized OB-fold protein